MVIEWNNIIGGLSKLMVLAVLDFVTFVSLISRRRHYY